jgi:hypothetical protein
MLNNTAKEVIVFMVKWKKDRDNNAKFMLTADSFHIYPAFTSLLLSDSEIQLPYEED